MVANIQKGQAPKRIRELAKYLAKYVVSPPISVRRIGSYHDQKVKYWYNDHMSGRLYATAVYNKIRKKRRAILPSDSAQCRETFSIARKGCRERVIETSAKDPFICLRCGGELILWKI